MRFHIIFRVCEEEASYHGLPKAFGLSKQELTISCLNSLEKAVAPLDHYFSVVGDRISKEMWERVNDKLHPINSFNSTDKLGLVGSLLKASEFGVLSKDDEILYLIEDDYLHQYDIFAERVLDFYDLLAERKFALPCFLHPGDYPCQYNRLLARSYIFQGKTGYWREVSSTTDTFMVPAQYYKKNIDFFRECYRNDGVNGVGSDARLSAIFKKQALCFCPLPGIATHMNTGVMSNYVDWRKYLS
jgi:hypothetical protein